MGCKQDERNERKEQERKRIADEIYSSYMTASEVDLAIGSSRRRRYLTPVTQQVCSKYPVLHGYPGYHRTFYLRAEVENLKATIPPPPRAEVQKDIEACLQRINDRAKVCRDLAQRYYKLGLYPWSGKHKYEKMKCYELKDKAIEYLFNKGEIRYVGVAHDMALYEGQYQTYHSTIFPPGKRPADLSAERVLISSRSKSRSKVRLRDAIETLTGLPPAPVDVTRRVLPPSVGRTRYFLPEWLLEDDDDMWDDDDDMLLDDDI